ncbi:hypothetical protein ACA910_019813 [Epithemia clementina (nom. ined.)]
MLDPAQVDAYFPRAAAVTMMLWICLIVLVYTITPATDWQYLIGWDRQVPLLASLLLTFSLISYLLLPWCNLLRAGQPPQRVSGILVAAICTMVISISTNLLLALCPTIVLMDPILHSKVFVLRWCEWIPLSGLLTFLADAVDLSKEEEDEEDDRKNVVVSSLMEEEEEGESNTPDSQNNHIKNKNHAFHVKGKTTQTMAARFRDWCPPRSSVEHALLQMISTTCGLAFAYSPNTTVWMMLQLCSWICYMPLFTRVEAKKQALLEMIPEHQRQQAQKKKKKKNQQRRGRGRGAASNKKNKNTAVLFDPNQYMPSSCSYLEKEAYDRRYFAYHLLRQCAIVWTCLIGLYYAHAIIFSQAAAATFWKYWNMEEGGIISNCCLAWDVIQTQAGLWLGRNDTEAAAAASTTCLDWISQTHGQLSAILTNDTDQESASSSSSSSFSSMAMWIDTAFDVLAKWLYLKVVVEVHEKVFDSNARDKCQLYELRRLMQLLWDSTTDTIIISVQGPNQTSTFLSPSFLQSFATPATPNGTTNDDAKDPNNNNRNNNHVEERSHVQEIVIPGHSDAQNDSSSHNSGLKDDLNASTSSMALIPSFLTLPSLLSSSAASTTTTTSSLATTAAIGRCDGLGTTTRTTTTAATTPRTTTTANSNSSTNNPYHPDHTPPQWASGTMGVVLQTANVAVIPTPPPSARATTATSMHPRTTRNNSSLSNLSFGGNDEGAEENSDDTLPTSNKLPRNDAKTKTTSSSSALRVLGAKYIDSTHISTMDADLEKLTVAAMDKDSPQVQLAAELVQACWTNLHERQQQEQLQQQQRQREREANQGDDANYDDDEDCDDDNQSNDSNNSNEINLIFSRPKNMSFLLVHEFKHPNAKNKTSKTKTNKTNGEDEDDDDGSKNDQSTCGSSSNQDDDMCSCELKVSQKSPESFVAIVRDVTERYRRFAAERAHAEALARQKDAQTANRFTRHEIKNGLLSGIELCDGLQRSLQRVTAEAMGGFSAAAAVAASSLTSDSHHEHNNNNARGSASVLLQEHGQQLQQLQMHPSLAKMAGLIGQVDRVFHEILDTVMADAMARDVMHECYEPNPIKADLVEILKSSCSRIGEKRFPLQVAPSNFPKLLLDGQLLRFIHRNAVSNATKYGKRGGVISTIVDYDNSQNQQMLTVKVINEPGPGHEKLLQDPEESSRSVFKAGKRLHNAINHDHSVSPHHEGGSNSDYYGGCRLSSGDGAWIMQKCAKNMGGVCSISFEQDRTVFEFCCRAPPVLDNPLDMTAPSNKKQEFFLPLNTWALGIDDSWIQRKLLLRIFANAGIHSTRRKAIGRSFEELETTAKILTEFLEDDPSAKCLVLVDENLDYVMDDVGTSRIIRSGSKMMESILNEMPFMHRSRVLTLVRSANDSSQDISLYRSRTDGFFPKMATRREDVMALLEPLWKERFGDEDAVAPPTTGLSKDLVARNNSNNNKDASDTDTDCISKDDLREAVSSVDVLLQGRSVRDVPWTHIWSSLHSLKGDLMMSEQADLKWASAEISQMRGPDMPEDFDERWSKRLRPAILKGIDSM